MLAWIAAHPIQCVINGAVIGLWIGSLIRGAHGGE